MTEALTPRNRPVSGCGKPSSTADKPVAPATPVVYVDLDREQKASLRHIGGSANDVVNNIIANAALQTLWSPASRSEEDQKSHILATIAAMIAFKPADEIEGMLAAQAIAMHNASMECSRRAMIPDQPSETAQGLRKAAANASRAFTELLTALDRKRGKGGQQKVTVEHVHVHSGGQAIVGAISQPKRGVHVASQSRAESRGAPTGLAHDPSNGAILPPLRSANPERQCVPLAGNEQRAMPDARGKKHRAANR